MNDQHKELHEENAALRARLAEVERERDEARRDRATMETAHGEVVAARAALAQTEDHKQ